MNREAFIEKHLEVCSSEGKWGKRANGKKRRLSARQCKRNCAKFLYSFQIKRAIELNPCMRHKEVSEIISKENKE